ncbi:hypothetical protein QQ045_001232 [Rhodiola kirilowii]
MMNVSPLFTNASDGFVGQQDGSSSQHEVRVSPTVPRHSVERPSPRSQPYPHASPGPDGLRGTFSSDDASGVPDDDPRKVLIRPLHLNRFKPKKTGADIGFDCMAKHWVAGWTTIQYCDESAKEQWFEEFKARVTWEPKHTTEIKRIFFEKCRKKLNDGWYNLHHSRCKEGLKFLKRHEVDEGLIWYIRNADLVKKNSERNKINSKGIEARVHRGGAKDTDEVYEELEITLEVVYCRDIYNRLKKKPDESYLCEDGQEKEGKSVIVIINLYIITRPRMRDRIKAGSIMELCPGRRIQLTLGDRYRAVLLDAHEQSDSYLFHCAVLFVPNI